MGVKLQSALGGSVELNAPSTASNFTMTVPAGNGTVATTDQLTNFRNRIINGDGRIDQRNCTQVFTATGGLQYSLDRWRVYGSPNSKFSIQQASANRHPSFSTYISATSLSAHTFGTGDVFRFEQPIEGNNIYDLEFGSGSAKSITVSFWVRSSLTGKFGLSLWDRIGEVSYPTSYNIVSANTWEYKTITVPGATIGTWEYGPGQGLVLQFNLGSGSQYISSNANTWQTGIYTAPTGCVNLCATNGATLHLTGVQLERGTVATPYEMRPFQVETALCQRYYVKSFRQTVKPANGQSNGVQIHTPAGNDPQVYVPFPVEMRTDPTVTLYNPYTGTAGQWYGAAFNNSTSSNARALSMTTRGLCIDNTDYGAPATGWCEIHFTAEAEI